MQIDLSVIEEALKSEPSEHPAKLHEYIHQLMDEVRRLEAVTKQMGEALATLEQEQTDFDHVVAAHLDIAADLVARLITRLGGTNPGLDDDYDDTSGEHHQHAWVDGRCYCGESVFLGNDDDNDHPSYDPASAVHHHDNCPYRAFTGRCPTCY